MKLMGLWQTSFATSALIFASDTAMIQGADVNIRAEAYQSLSMPTWHERPRTVVFQLVLQGISSQQRTTYGTRI